MIASLHAAIVIAIATVHLLGGIPQSFGDSAMQLQVSEIRIFGYDRNNIDYHFNRSPLSTIHEGMEIAVNGLVRNQSHTGEHFDYITVILDNDGYARYVHVRQGVAVPLSGQIVIDSETHPVVLDPGNYTVKVFTWGIGAGSNNPMALSSGATRSITIASTDRSAWLAMNTTQCSNPCDVEYMKEYRNAPAPEKLQGDGLVVQWYFAKRGIEIHDVQNVGYLPDNVGVCEACNCTSGKALYVKVAGNNIEEVKGFGFVEKKPPFDA